MAPELATNSLAVSEKVDVWSLGVVLWEMLTLQTPFAEYSPQEILAGALPFYVLLLHVSTNSRHCPSVQDMHAQRWGQVAGPPWPVLCHASNALSHYVIDKQAGQQHLREEYSEGAHAWMTVQSCLMPSSPQSSTGAFPPMGQLVTLFQCWRRADVVQGSADPLQLRAGVGPPTGALLGAQPAEPLQPARPGRVPAAHHRRDRG